MFAAEFGALPDSFRLEPNQQVGAVPGCQIGYRLEAVGKPLRIGFPGAGIGPVAPTRIPPGIDPPDVKVKAEPLELLHIPELVLFRRAREFLALIRGGDSQQWFQWLAVGPGQNVSKVPAAPQVHRSGRVAGPRQDGHAWCADAFAGP